MTLHHKAFRTCLHWCLFREIAQKTHKKNQLRPAIGCPSEKQGRKVGPAILSAHNRGYTAAGVLLIMAPFFGCIDRRWM